MQRQHRGIEHRAQHAVLAGQQQIAGGEDEGRRDRPDEEEQRQQQHHHAGRHELAQPRCAWARRAQATGCCSITACTAAGSSSVVRPVMNSNMSSWSSSAGRRSLPDQLDHREDAAQHRHRQRHHAGAEAVVHAGDDHRHEHGEQQEDDEVLLDAAAHHAPPLMASACWRLRRQLRTNGHAVVSTMKTNIAKVTGRVKMKKSP